ncbi:MAG: SufE family protein [Variibacter sp.]|nr:SufE family protein [Variibacter sp.]
MPTIDEIIENFSLLEEWDDRYRYLIELGRTLAPLPDALRTESTKVQGCASQVWLWTTVHPDGEASPILTFLGDSDAHIVRGLIAILIALYSGKRAHEILETDALALFDRLALREHLTPQRSNGLRSMVARIRSDAASALARPAERVQSPSAAAASSPAADHARSGAEARPRASLVRP